MSEPLFVSLSDSKPELTQVLSGEPMLETDQLETDQIDHIDYTAQSELEAALAELQSGDFHQRWDAAKRLPGLGNQAIAPLLQLISAATDDPDDDWELLWFVARILGNFQHPAAVAALANLLKSSPDLEITAMATTALINFGDLALPALTDLSKQPSTRLIALQALAQIQHPQALSPLLEATSDRLPEMRAAAISALGQAPQANSDCWTACWTGLSDPEAAVRQAAVRVIGMRVEQFTAQFGTEKLVAAISPLLKSEPEVARQAALTLGRIGSESAVVSLGQVLHQPIDQATVNLQIEVLHALAWTEQPTALAQIQQYLHLRRATALEQEVVTVLGQATAQATATQILLDLLTSAHPIAQTVRGKQQIALSLGQLQQPEAIDPLIELLTDSTASVQLHVMAALKQLAARGAAARLRQRLVEPYSSPELKARISTVLQDFPLVTV